jgi:hypothetical protein
MVQTDQSRRLLKLPARLIFEDGTPSAACIISEISRSGAFVSVEQPDNVPSRATLWMTPDGKVCRPCTVVTRTLTGVGVQFEE